MHTQTVCLMHGLPFVSAMILQINTRNVRRKHNHAVIILVMFVMEAFCAICRPYRWSWFLNPSNKSNSVDFFWGHFSNFLIVGNKDEIFIWTIHNGKRVWAGTFWFIYFPWRTAPTSRLNQKVKSDLENSILFREEFFSLLFCIC